MIATPSRVRELYEYDSETGEIKSRRTGKVMIGQNILIDNEKLMTARCIWAYYYDSWPPNGMLIDHKDRNRSNNRISNLRLATYSQNGFNMVSNNEYGKGVTYDSSRPRNPWRAQIRINGVKVNLGRFRTKEQAAETYRQAAIEHHGEFVCLD